MDTSEVCCAELKSNILQTNIVLSHGCVQETHTPTTMLHHKFDVHSSEKMFSEVLQHDK